MSIYTSSRAEAHKREREEKKRAAESAGTSVTAQVVQSTQKSKAAEKRSELMAQKSKTTVDAGVSADKPAAKPATTSGYVPTYGNNLLYTSAGNTATVKTGGLNTSEKRIGAVGKQARERKWYDTALDMANHAAGVTVTGATGLIDGLANTIPTIEGALMKEEPNATFTGQLLRPITFLTGKLDDWAVNETIESAQQWQNDFADKPWYVQKAGETAFLGMAAAPAIASALLTSGASLAGTTVNASGAPVLNSAGNVALGTKLVDKVTSGIKDPKVIFSALRDYGAGKSDALANGATKEEADNVGVLQATTNLAIGQGTLGNLLPGPVEEGVKNVVQEYMGGGIEKVVYDEDKKWFGWNDDNAVINPVKDAGTFISGAVPSMLSSGAQNLKQFNTDVQAGKVIKSSGKTTDLLQDALKATTDGAAYNMAKEMSERLEVALIETGMDASDLYRMSKKDQQNLITNVINQTLTNREIGELARMLSTTQ